MTLKPEDYDELSDEELELVNVQSEKTRSRRLRVRRQSNTVDMMRAFLATAALPHRKPCACYGKVIDSRCLKDVVHDAGYTIAEYL